MRFWDANEIEQFVQPNSWRIIRQGESAADREEVVLTIQGALQTKELPPLNAKPRYGPSNSLPNALPESAITGYQLTDIDICDKA
jgi:hypothetical protein